MEIGMIVAAAAALTMASSFCSVGIARGLSGRDIL